MRGSKRSLGRAPPPRRRHPSSSAWQNNLLPRLSSSSVAAPCRRQCPRLQPDRAPETNCAPLPSECSRLKPMVLALPCRPEGLSSLIWRRVVRRASFAGGGGGGGGRRVHAATRPVRLK